MTESGTAFLHSEAILIDVRNDIDDGVTKRVTIPASPINDVSAFLSSSSRSGLKISSVNIPSQLSHLLVLWPVTIVKIDQICGFKNLRRCVQPVDWIQIFDSQSLKICVNN